VSYAPRVLAVAALAPRLLENRTEVLREVLQVAKAVILDERSRAEALAALAPQLPQDLAIEAIQTARGLSSSGNRALALGSIIRYLPEDKRSNMLGELLQTIRETTDESIWVKTIATVVPNVPSLNLEAWLQIAREIQGPADRTTALAAFARHLQEAARIGALHEILAAAGATRQKEGAGSLARPLERYIYEKQMVELFENAGVKTRQEFLVQLLNAIPAMAYLEGVVGLREVRRAVCQTAKWFP
jgi:Tfp pilus assembly protein PilN